MKSILSTLALVLSAAPVFAHSGSHVLPHGLIFGWGAAVGLLTVVPVTAIAYKRAKQ